MWIIHHLLEISRREFKLSILLFTINNQRQVISNHLLQNDIHLTSLNFLYLTITSCSYFSLTRINNNQMLFLPLQWQCCTQTQGTNYTSYIPNTYTFRRKRIFITTRTRSHRLITTTHLRCSIMNHSILFLPLLTLTSSTCTLLCKWLLVRSTMTQSIYLPPTSLQRESSHNEYLDDALPTEYEEIKIYVLATRPHDEEYLHGEAFQTHGCSEWSSPLSFLQWEYYIREAV